MVNSFQNTFKELDLTQLEIYAEKWAKEFSLEFDRIILFKYLNPHKALHEHAMQGSIPGRYLVLFELKESTSSAFNKMIQATAEESGILSEDLSEKAIIAIWNHVADRYDRLLSATGQYNTILDPNINADLKMLRDNHFYRVYKNKSDCILFDWMFRVKDPHKGLPLGIKEEEGYFWVLYDSNKKDLIAVDIQKKTIADDKQKTGTRSKSAETIYIAAAARAESLIKGYIKDDILPETRAKKLEMIKVDRIFIKIIAALPRTVKDKHIIRKLHEACPGIWKLGESSNKREQNKKYRPKSLYF